MQNPFPELPAGWYALIPTAEVPLDCPVEVPAFGTTLTVWRTLGAHDGSGAVAAGFSACPHLGANLAAATVRRGCLRCPMHGWTFGAAGELKSIPGSDRLVRASMRMVPTVVVDGLLLGWWHPGGDEPWWMPPSLVPPPQARTELVTVRDVVETRHEPAYLLLPTDIVENLFDISHFKTVHLNVRVPSADELEFLDHQAKIRVTQLGSDPVQHRSVADGLGRCDTRIYPDQGEREYSTVQGFYTAVRPETRFRLTAFISSYATQSPHRTWDPETAAAENARFRTTSLAHSREADGKVLAERQRVTPVWGPHDRPLRAFRDWAKRFDTTASSAADR